MFYNNAKIFIIVESMKRLGINSLNLFSFSVVNKLPSLTQQHARLTRELRSSINIDETIQIVEKNLKEIN